MNNQRLKVVWICHFSNAFIREKLGIKKTLNDFAPWITLSIEEAKKRHDKIELHVISPHKWIKKTKRFKDLNINYYFFNSGIPYYGRHWPGIFRWDYWSKFYDNRRKIKKIVNSIEPDIINLHGIENPYYSLSIFDLKKYPILITIQGIKSLYETIPKKRIIQRDIYYEKKLIKSFNNFGIRVKFLEKYISNLNPRANFFWFKYPYVLKKKEFCKINRHCKNDIIYFARIEKNKGIEDLLKAILILKKNYPNIKAKIIGAAPVKYLSFLHNYVKDNGLNENIEFIGFINRKSLLNELVFESKMTVLPTYNDILPGTIIESLNIGTPVIAYNANGVIDFNENGEIIKLVPKGNINKLSQEIENLLINKEEREKLIQNGFSWIENNADSGIEFDKLLNSYNDIVHKS